MRTDIALSHIADNDDVNFLYYNNSINSQIPNMLDFLIPVTNSKDLFSIPIKNRYYINIIDNKLDIPNFKSIEDLKKFEVDGFDIGSSVASSLISMLYEPRPNLIEHRDIYHSMINEAYSIYLSALDSLNKIKPDIFYLYNGRFHIYRPLLRAAQKLGINTIVYGASIESQKYYFIKNTFIHDINYIKTDIEEKWSSYSNTKERKEIAVSWFLNNRMGGKNNFYISEQTKNKIPDNFDHSKRNVVIFNSSEDELEAIDDWKNTFVKSQNDGIRFIVENIQDKNIHFYLRVHPNLKNINNSQTKEIILLKYSNLTIISPESSIDSYNLIKICEKVIVFGSTIGVESCFWNRPVILLGRAKYEALNTCYIAKDYVDSINLIQKKLKPMKQKNALKYGFYEKNKSISVSLFEIDSLYANCYFKFYLANYMQTASQKYVDIMELYYDSYNYYQKLKEYKNVRLFKLLLLYISRNLLQIKKNNDAEKIINELKIYSPQSVESLLSIAEFNHYNKNYKNAIYYYEMILKIEINELNFYKNLFNNLDFQLYINLQIGRCLDLLLDVRAIDYFKNSVDRSNNNQITFFILKYYLIRNNLEDSITYYISNNIYINNAEKEYLISVSQKNQKSYDYFKLQLNILDYLYKINIWFIDEKIQIKNKMDEIKTMLINLIP